MEQQKSELYSKAKEIINFNSSLSKGGYVCSHKVSVYGKVLKYIFAEREWTFMFVGELLSMTPQNVNYIVNRMNDNNFNCIFLKRICNRLSIDYDYFCKLCDIVREIEK